MANTPVERMQEYNRIHEIDHIILDILGKNGIESGIALKIAEEVSIKIRNHYVDRVMYFSEQNSKDMQRYIDAEYFISRVAKRLTLFNTGKTRQKCIEYLRNAGSNFIGLI